MPDPKIEAMAYPRGREGLLGKGPIAPGPGEVPPVRCTAEEEAREAGENLERLGHALAPQIAAELGAAAGRAEARNAVREILVEERQSQEDEATRRKDRLRPFFGFLDSLRDLATEGPTGGGPEGKTELTMKLYRLEPNGGPNPTRVFQTQVNFSQAEALALGDPDFEGRAMAWALEQGVFGRFEWRLLGWADGESVLDTAYRVTVEQPAGYKPPARATAPQEAEAKPAPLDQLKDTLGMLGMMREALGLKGSGGGLDATQIEIIKAAASSQARLEAANEHRRELRELEDRHRKELDEADRKGYDRGKAEGERTLEAERLRWDLAKAQESPEGPTFARDVADILGGPEAVQKLVGGIVAFLNKPKTPQRPQRPGGPVRPPQATPHQRQPALNPGSAEPTRAQWHEAMRDLEEGIEVMRELKDNPEASPEDREQAVQLLPVFEAYHQRGTEDGSLAAWWAEWPEADAILTALFEEKPAHQPEEETTMDTEALKTQLIQRLDEGATDEAILDELRATIPAATLAQAKGMLHFATPAMVAGMLGVPEQHHGRIETLLDALRA